MFDLSLHSPSLKLPLDVPSSVRLFSSDDNGPHVLYVTKFVCLFVCLCARERLEDNPHQIMFGKGPEIALFETIAPYVSFGHCCFCRL